MPWGVAAAAVVGAYTSNKSSKRAAEAQQDATDQSIAYTREATAEARKDIDKYFPQAQATTAAGFKGALDTFNQFMPAQTDVYQQGNVGAQQALLSGLPQMQNAILGAPIDYSAFQPQRLDFDTSIFNQSLPTEMTNIVNQNQPAVGPQQNQQPDMNITPFQNFLSNWNGAQNGASSFSPYQRIF